jgi:methylmalonyl-CoA/ethylmalonyl-CoA epimerase
MSDFRAAEVSQLPGLLGIDHVGIAVADLEAAIAFHTGTLGLVVAHREVNPDQAVEEVMLVPVDGDRSAQVQLVAALAEDSTVGRFLNRRGPGLHHLAYRVSDLSLVTRVLHKSGIRLIYDSARAGTRGSRINFVHPKDTGGTLVELVEPAAEDLATPLSGGQSLRP